MLAPQGRKHCAPTNQSTLTGLDIIPRCLLQRGITTEVVTTNFDKITTEVVTTNLDKRTTEVVTTNLDKRTTEVVTTNLDKRTTEVVTMNRGEVRGRLLNWGWWWRDGGRFLLPCGGCGRRL